MATRNQIKIQHMALQKKQCQQINVDSYSCKCVIKAYRTVHL